ncbi:hypothetical protein DFJ77DRAFT_55584 [Powellomyces hirtus]|nr:hypothetical protein DFJ77DRAFT_55584 [Powellomyces hirtus]
MAVAVLEAHGWDLQASITSMFEDGPDAATPAANADDSGGERDLDGTSLGTGGVQRGTFSIWSLLALPVTLPLNVVWILLSYAASFLPAAFRPAIARAPPPASRREDPQAEAARFALDFDQKYGATHPEFFAGTYAQALQKAKTELRYLVAYLHSAEHDDTDAFCRRTLCAPELAPELTRRNVLLWGGDIRNTEAFQVSNILGASRYPFLAIIAPHQSRLSIVDRKEGPCSAADIVSSLTTVMERMDPELATLRAERQAREQTRLIREQQDEAYQASLRADKEKQRKASEEQARKDRERRRSSQREQALLDLTARKKARIAQLVADLPPEPPASTPNTTYLSIRLPGGSRALRRFHETDTVRQLYEFVETRELDPIPINRDFVVVGVFPRKEFNEPEKTLKEVELCPSATLHVEEKINPDEDDGDDDDDSGDDN